MAMAKLTLDELRRSRAEAQKSLYLREGEFRGRIIVHMGTCGIAAGARAVVAAFLEALHKSRIKDIMVRTSGCAGLCSKEPMATVEMRNAAPVKYGELTPEKAGKIFQQHILGGTAVAEYALGLGSERGA
jgi:NADP-reducing hydrogenase subunit HndB